MIRRSFRFGLLLGLLGGAAVTLAKVFGARSPQRLAPTTGPVTDPWPRLASDPTVAAAPIARPIPDPAAPAVTAPVKTAPTKKAAAKRKAPAKAWVEPKGGVCPTSHPVKAKLASKIFHLPGMLNYDRTNPDRCYVDAKKAEADGLRAAKR